MYIYISLVYIKKYSILIDHHIYTYSQSTNITCSNELIVFLIIKLNIKNFPINDSKKMENFLVIM